MPYKAIAQGPYSSQICTFIARTFPQSTIDKAGDIVEILSEELYGTKQVRYGPKPSPESQVAIRATIRKYVAEYLPLPVVVPWGSEKPDGSSIDIAEIMALHQLADLDRRIRAHYTPGTAINVRLDDASAPHLFHWRAEEAWDEATRYTGDFVDLVKILGAPVNPRPESMLVSPDEFARAANERLPDFEKAIISESADHWEALAEKWGWRGRIPIDTQNYYLRTYEKMYPDNTYRDNLILLARYFAGASARVSLKLRGDLPQWNGDYLEVSFVPPIPGMPNHFSKRVIYRTVPLNFTSNHIPPWRGKGYFHVSESDELTPKLTTFGSDKVLEPCTITLQDVDSTFSVQVRADYELQE